MIATCLRVRAQCGRIRSLLDVGTADWRARRAGLEQQVSEEVWEGGLDRGRKSLVGGLDP